METGTHGLQPTKTLGNSLVIEQEAAKKQAEQHDKNTNQVCDTLVLDDDANAQAYCSRSKVEENNE